MFVIYTGDNCTAIRPGDRLDCGYPGISESTCEGKGCCYDEKPGTNWCFYPAGEKVISLKKQLYGAGKITNIPVLIS